MDDRQPRLENCPPVVPVRTFPKGARYPRGAIVVCPWCDERHWIAVDAAAPMHRCPRTMSPFVLDVSELVI